MRWEPEPFECGLSGASGRPDRPKMPGSGSGAWGAAPQRRGVSGWQKQGEVD